MWRPSSAPVAQLDRVPDYESGGRRFESFRARQFPQFTSCPVLRPGDLFAARKAPWNPHARILLLAQIEQQHS